ncbi:bestrophin family ion channel [Limibacter armeniacum]|uniref:bestrophin family protein n=1 Tax=Limibacter armeniacum TaxID=466084 RepID=UPI002FE5AB30
MLTNRSLRQRHLVAWLTKHIVWLLIFNGIIAALYAYDLLAISIPWLPVSVIGTAVAFFVGFKNNQAYDRLWEARKIWSGIKNNSRTWGMMVMGFVCPFDSESHKHISEVRKQLIYRHIAWIYAHRKQLLEPMAWERASSKSYEGRRAKKFDRKFGLGTVKDVSIDDLTQFISAEELQQMKGYKNMTTQLINEQSLELTKLKDQGYFDDFRHMELVKLLQLFYTLQGQNERIKKFPLPRGYSYMSNLIVVLFTFLIPFSLIPELMKLGHWALWLSIPISTLVGLVFIIMEDLGDYNESPFMGTPNSTPMLSLCRTIENDLREMLGEKDLPPSINDVGGVLM